MFIKKLFQYNKALFALFIAGILLFIIINYKWGIVATPILQFGMYSSVFHIKDTQTVYLVKVNGRMIRNADISLTSRDILQVFPENYEKQERVNEAAYATMKKYIGYTGLSRYMQFVKYHNRITDSLFTNWYKTKIEKITGSPVHSLKLYRQHFIWNENKLEPFGTAVKLIDFGTQ